MSFAEQSIEDLWQELAAEPGFYPNSSEPQVARFLAALVDLTEARAVLELGAHRGATTMWLAEAAGRIGGTVTAVDMLDSLDPRVKSRFGNLRFVHSDSIGALEQFAVSGERFDLVFVDDLHTFDHVSAVLARLPRVTRPRGLWAFHDVFSFPGVGRAIEAYEDENPCERLLLPTPDVSGRPLHGGQCSGLAVVRPFLGNALS